MAEAYSYMQYGNVTFYTMPESIEINTSKQYAKHKYLQCDGEYVEDLGIESPTVKGVGYFFGKDCYNEFEKLYSEFKLRKPREVVIPAFPNEGQGLMTSLKGTASEPDLVKFEFEIIYVFTPSHAYTKVTVATATAKKTTTKVTYKTYKVKKNGENLDKIIKTMNSKYKRTGSKKWTKAQIKSLNKIKNVKKLKKNQVLKFKV